MNNIKKTLSLLSIALSGVLVLGNASAQSRTYDAGPKEICNDWIQKIDRNKNGVLEKDEAKYYNDQLFLELAGEKESLTVKKGRKLCEKYYKNILKEKNKNYNYSSYDNNPMIFGLEQKNNNPSDPLNMEQPDSGNVQFFQMSN